LEIKPDSHLIVSPHFFTITLQGRLVVRIRQLAVAAGAFAAILFGISSFAFSSETTPVNIERFAVAKPAAARATSARTLERTAVIDGTQYAVIAPIFTELNTGNYSFIRFQNLISIPSTFTVRVVGSPSGNVYGQTTYSVAASASKHVQIADILSAASAATLIGSDTAYALYISNPDLSGYQHVIYNYVSEFFENASLCQTSLNQAAVRYLPNVHTNIIADAGFPSKIYMHNYANQAVTYNVSVYESSAGSLIGIVPVATQANSTYVMDFSFFQTQLGWTATGAQGYANLIFTPQTAISGVTLPPVIVGHFIFNEAFQAFVNMSESCAVNPGDASTGSTAATAATTYAGTISGVNGVSGTLTVNIPTSASTASASLAERSQSVEKAQATVTATGTLVINGTTTTLTGTYDTTTEAVTLTGGGYNFGGDVSSGAFSGSYTGPAGASGSFSTLDTTSTLVTAYCGTYRDNPPDDFTGTFNITVSLRGSVRGTFSGTAGSGSLTGTVTGSSISIVKAGDPAIIRGTISGTTLSGTSNFNDGSGGSGTFTGQKCDLPAAG
jgi:hypothetical protein